MMTLDEAIEHCIEKSKCLNNECELEYKQLAEWLKELKEYRENDKWLDNYLESE